VDDNGHHDDAVREMLNFIEKNRTPDELRPGVPRIGNAIPFAFATTDAELRRATAAAGVAIVPG
jgi:hypothetical protein